MKRLSMLIVSAALATVPLAGCGSKHDQLAPGHQQSVSVMLDWFPNADHVGLYQALSDGSFSKAGLNVHVETPSNPSTPLQLLAAGKVDFAISYEPEVLLARNQGMPLVSIAAIVQKPLTSVISLSKHVKSISALRGKTVGDAGIPYQHVYLDTILAHAGVPASSVHEVNVGATLVSSMVSGKVDATLGGFSNYEAIQLAQMGKKPTVIPVNRAGIPSYDELVLVVRRSELAENSDMVRQFAQALGHGYEAVRRDPAAGVASLVKANPGLDRKLQLASVRATLPAFFPAHSGQPWGFQSSWNAYAQWMLDHHLISNPAAITGASTNEVLAGQGI